VKICLASSAGGHLTQLLRLTPACEGHSYFIVTTGTQATKSQDGDDRTYTVGWANRNHPFLMAKMVVRCHRILAKERPDVLISTGAAVGCVLAILMKLRRRKVVWIDTISHPEYLTLGGRIIKPFADVFLVQWPDLTEKYRGTKYVGSVL
jgi:UDP-N-acetylglucosamine:LPS N-acetylglucosamine transferase